MEYYIRSLVLGYPEPHRKWVAVMPACAEFSDV